LLTHQSLGYAYILNSRFTGGRLALQTIPCKHSTTSSWLLSSTLVFVSFQHLGLSTSATEQKSDIPFSCYSGVNMSLFIHNTILLLTVLKYLCKRPLQARQVRLLFFTIVNRIYNIYIIKFTFSCVIHLKVTMY
jgi:hypothetical protein